MENKFRNEKLIKLGEVEILLRPTFENIAALEGTLGGLAYLGWKFARTKADNPKLVDPKALPPMTECAQIIFFSQAEKKYSLEQIWELVQIEGIAVVKPILEFMSLITAGNKATNDLTEGQKKS